MKALVWLLCLGVMAASGIRTGHADQTPGPPISSSAWLVTYGPGEIYWQRFGHNAIWIRDAGLGIDHVFNFGFFDFEQQSFLLRFLQGRLLYFSAAFPAEQEFAQYINENRSIRAQLLDLTAAQALGLADYLVNEVQPENREYLYDYYSNNCSTRVRDALDTALGGKIRAAFGAAAAAQTLRDHTRRLTIADYWLYLGLEIGLGSPVDQPINRWDEFFVPAELADGLAQFTQGSGTNRKPLVVEDLMLFTSTLASPPAKVSAWWPRYLLIAAGLLILAVLLHRLMPPLQSFHLARTWLVISGFVGLVVVYLWFFTDHHAARNNMNLALFNPLWLLCLAGRRLQVLCAGLVIGLGLLALLFTQLPPHQYSADVLSAFLPINFAAALVLLQFRHRTVS
jgi:hypothetical protein